MKKERLEEMFKQKVDDSASITVQDELITFANFDAKKGRELRIKNSSFVLFCFPQKPGFWFGIF